MKFDSFFWLHIKKSAGMSVRQMLGPLYTQVDRIHQPKNFIMANESEYNDIINNFRVPLGRYQFKRCLFAREFLYRERWNSMYSFAFSRNPLRRCLSMFHYLFYRGAGVNFTLARLASRSVASQLIKHPINLLKLEVSRSYAFDVFLDFVELARLEESIYEPLGLHFATHTATVWDDISDDYGKPIITRTFRLEDLSSAVSFVLGQCGIQHNSVIPPVLVNSNTKQVRFNPSRLQSLRIERIYARDYDIYESSPAP